jgi:hypothetical protein
MLAGRDRRWRIYAKAKAETSWRFWGANPETARLRMDAVEYGLAVTLRLFNGYRVVRPGPKVAPAK